MANVKKNSTNTMDYWKIYPVGKYSGSKRIDPSKEKEREIDNDYTKQLWIEDREEILNDPDFLEDIQKKIEGWDSVFKMTGFDKDTFDVIYAGQSHIDMAWKWRYEQTRQKGAITFHKAMYHAKNFPGFSYCASEPILFDWFKEDDPDGFEELKKIVAEGGIELVGGAYVEPDCMMPSGEAFVRSRLLGMRFYKEHFGEDKLPKVEYFLDSFGYNYGLPQILKKSGAKYFWTSKITWNRQTIFPFVNFMWKSPDGTELLTSNFKQMMGVLDEWMMYELGRHPLKEGGQKVWTYANRDYEEIDEEVEMEEIMPPVGVFHGKGDGGHGPTHQEVTHMQGLIDAGFGHWGTAEEYYKKLEPFVDRMPVWDDELYLEYHRGTFSIHWDVKRHNRLYENLLLSVENLASILGLANVNYEYPQEELEDVWKILLLNQFHDVLPGSSIPEVYDDVYGMWMDSNEILKRINKKYVDALPLSKDADLIIENPLTWERESPTFISLELVKSKVGQVDENNLPYLQLVNLYDDSDKIICQPIAAESFVNVNDPDENYPAGWWTMVDIKGLSVKSYKIEVLESTDSLESSLSVSENGLALENSLVKIEISDKTGALLKIESKDGINGGNNLLKGDQSNLTLGYLDDYPHDHAWNIKPQYWDYPLVVPNDNDVKITVENIGPIFTTVAISRLLGEGPIKETLKKGDTVGASKVVQKVTLFKNMPEIYLTYEADWQQPWNMLKVQYNTATNAETTVSEQCYGAIERSTRPKTRADIARFEKIMQKYCDLSTPDKSWGLAMVNEGKYAYDTNEDTMRLTVVRTATYPTAAAEAFVHKERKERKNRDEGEVPNFIDLGDFRCRYALLPHNGGALSNFDGSANDVVAKSAQEFNKRMLVNAVNIEVSRSSDDMKYLVDGTEIISSSKGNVQVITMKRKSWETSRNLILRVFEMCGVDTGDVEIKICKEVAEKIKEVKPTDLLERPIENSDFIWDKESFTLIGKIGKFEIKSFELMY